MWAYFFSKSYMPSFENSRDPYYVIGNYLVIMDTGPGLMV